MKRTISILVPLLFLWPLCGYANPSPAGTVIDVGSKKQLFIDDLFVASWHGVRLTVNPPRKTRERNLVPDPDRPWEAVRVAYPCTVMEDGGKYRMWYDAMHHRQPEDQLPYRIVCYAESDDGIHWRKPIVGAYTKYVGFDYTHGDRDALEQGGNGVISRLVLRLDGFVYADADYQGERSSAVRSASRGTASS